MVYCKIITESRKEERKKKVKEKPNEIELGKQRLVELEGMNLYALADDRQRIQRLKKKEKKRNKN